MVTRYVTSITIKGDTIPLQNATLDLDNAAITCRYSEELAHAFTGWMPVDVLLNMPPCKFPVLLRVIDVEALHESRQFVIEFDGPEMKREAMNGSISQADVLNNVDA